MTINRYFSNALARLGTAFCIVILLSGCLKDDFNKLSESEWSPDLAFPIIYSDLGIEDIATQKDSTVTVGVNTNNIVEIIYTSLNYTQRANEILSLPEIDANFHPSISPSNTQAFNGFRTI